MKKVKLNKVMKSVTLGNQKKKKEDEIKRRENEILVAVNKESKK